MGHGLCRDHGERACAEPGWDDRVDDRMGQLVANTTELPDESQVKHFEDDALDCNKNAACHPELNDDTKKCLNEAATAEVGASTAPERPEEESSAAAAKLDGAAGRIVFYLLEWKNLPF